MHLPISRTKINLIYKFGVFKKSWFWISEKWFKLELRVEKSVRYWLIDVSIMAFSFLPRITIFVFMCDMSITRGYILRSFIAKSCNLHSYLVPTSCNGLLNWKLYSDIVMPNCDLLNPPMIKLFGIPMSNLCIFRVIHIICLDLLLRSNSYKKLLILVVGTVSSSSKLSCQGFDDLWACVLTKYVHFLFTFEGLQFVSYIFLSK